MIAASELRSLWKSALGLGGQGTTWDEINLPQHPAQELSEIFQTTTEMLSSWFSPWHQGLSYCHFVLILIWTSA